MWKIFNQFVFFFWQISIVCHKYSCHCPLVNSEAEAVITPLGKNSTVKQNARYVFIPLISLYSMSEIRKSWHSLYVFKICLSYETMWTKLL